MGKITIQEVSAKLVAQNGLSKKEATRFVNKMFDLIRDALERDMTVKVKGLGTFKIIDVDSRESVNVNTGERVLIEGHNKITFTPDVLMKELVNKPFSQFETIVLNEGVDFKDSDNEDVEAQTEDDGEMGDMPLVDFIAPDPIDIGVPVDKVKPVTPLVSESPVIPKPVAASEASATEEIPIVSEAQDGPAGSEQNEVEEMPAESVADIPPSQEDPAEELSSEDEYVEKEEDEAVTEGVKWPMVLLACVGALIVGYLLGNYFPWNRQGELVEAKTPQVEKVQKVAPVKKAETKVVADTKPEVVEQPETPKPAEAQKPVETLKPVETPKVVETTKPVEAKKPSEAPQKSVSVAPAEVKLDKYEAKDVRVRTGAYRIVGTDHVEKVKEGDNLKRIAKRTLGQDMECYLEVYNNLTSTSELKKGQEIKIPKLELKKKKTVQKQ